MRRVSLSRVCLGILFVLMVSAAALATPDVPLPARFTAWAVNMARGGTTSVDLTVTRWSTPAEVDQLSSAFNDRGTDGLVGSLERLPHVGSYRTNGGLAYDIQFAQRTPDPEGGERILVIAERRVGFVEMANLTPSADYPLMVMELHVNAGGDGTGTLWPVARISYWDSKTQFVVVDNYTMQPIRLTAVKLQTNRQA